MMLKNLSCCFAVFFIGYAILRALPLPFSYIQNLTSFFGMLVALAAIYTVLKHAFKEQIEQASERQKTEKAKSLSWSVYPSLVDFSDLIGTLDIQEGLFLYNKVEKAQELLRDKFTDTAKNWFLADLISYYEYVAERTSLSDFARMSENIAQIDYIDKKKRLDILRELSLLAKLQKEYNFVRQTSAVGKMSAHYYKSYEIINAYNKENLKFMLEELLEQIEIYLDIPREKTGAEE